MNIFFSFHLRAEAITSLPPSSYIDQNSVLGADDQVDAYESVEHKRRKQLELTPSAEIEKIGPLAIQVTRSGSTRAISHKSSKAPRSHHLGWS